MATNKSNPKEIAVQYPVGARIELLQMDDPQAPPVGTLGTVRGVDDAGHILMSWDTGSGLSLIRGVDLFKKKEDFNE